MTQPQGGTTKQLPTGLSEERARKEGWTFQAGSHLWKPPDGYDPQKVCRDLLTQNLGAELIRSIRSKGYFSVDGADGKYYAFSPQQFCDHQAPSERPKAEALMRKNNIKVRSA